MKLFRNGVMVQFEVALHVVALPITFEQSTKDVENILGPPDTVDTSWRGERVENRGFMNVRYSRGDGKVEEIGFVPGSRLFFKNRNLFEIPDVLTFLMQHDPHPYESLGFLVFMELGISTRGFHDGDESQKAITVFRKGAWDSAKERFKSFRPRSG